MTHEFQRNKFCSLCRFKALLQLACVFLFITMTKKKSSYHRKQFIFSFNLYKIDDYYEYLQYNEKSFIM